jgi:hypothetical protein
MIEKLGLIPKRSRDFSDFTIVHIGCTAMQQLLQMEPSLSTKS